MIQGGNEYEKFVIEKSTDEESNLIDKGINEYNSSKVPFAQEHIILNQCYLCKPDYKRWC